MDAAENSPAANVDLTRALWLGLGLSGTASVANQVLWQRGLTVVGGSGSLATTLTVLVFMGGLGLGALWASARGRDATRPMTTLATIELALCLLTAAIAWLLNQSPDEAGAGALWRWTLGSPWLLAVVAVGLLGPPTLLMGATLPLAAFARQRHRGRDRQQDITMLFVVNTLGAVLGAAGTGLWLLPQLGQRNSLLCACALNALAAAVLWRAGQAERRTQTPLQTPRRATPPAKRGWAITSATHTERMGLALGVLSLGYEMYLVRLATLHYGPFPYTFALTLCGFLLLWAGGALLAARTGWLPDIATGCLATAIAVLAGVFATAWLPEESPTPWLHAAALCCLLPVTGFGLLYGRLVSAGAGDWGRDVGRFYALNTLGSCAGVLWISLIGYELQHSYNAYLIGGGLLCLGLWPRTGLRPAAAGALCATLLLGLTAAGRNPTGRIVDGRMTFHGRDGVVELDRAGNVMVDGLWHSRLSTDGNHIGKPYNWGMAVAGVLGRGAAGVKDALVVGNGVGITAATLALMPDVQIDAYEINRTLHQVMRRYPKRSLGAASHPRIHIRWRDARGGLLEDPKRYDLIVSSPLHLSQAGSTLLLSRQYLGLLKRRLKAGGVIVLFSDEGFARQAAMVAATVRSEFEFTATFDRQLITVASSRPLALEDGDLAIALRRPDPLMRQLLAFERARAAQGKAGFLELLDGPLPAPPKGTPLITDDRPLVEYPYL